MFTRTIIKYTWTVTRSVETGKAGGEALYSGEVCEKRQKIVLKL